MGFSIKAFFEELQAILDDSNLDSLQKLDALEHAIDMNQEYAAECGQLS